MCSFMLNYLQTASFFVDGEPQSERINDFLALCKCSSMLCEFSCWYIRIHVGLLAKFEFPAQKMSKSCLNVYK